MNGPLPSSGWAIVDRFDGTIIEQTGKGLLNVYYSHADASIALPGVKAGVGARIAKRLTIRRIKLEGIEDVDPEIAKLREVRAALIAYERIPATDYERKPRPEDDGTRSDALLRLLRALHATKNCDLPNPTGIMDHIRHLKDAPLGRFDRPLRADGGV